MGTRLLVGLLVGLMAIGSLGLWVAIPLAWLWAVQEVDSAGTRFLVAIAGCVATMAGGGWLLYRLEAVYARTAGKDETDTPPPRWMRSNAELQAPRPPLSLLDTLLIGSALIAVVALIVWWALFADSPNPSGPLQPL